MLSPRHFGRGRVSAAAVAAAVIVTPAAIAAVPDAVASLLTSPAGPATAKAPAGTAAASAAAADAGAGAPSPGTPIKSGLLRLDLAAAASAPVDGAVQLAAGGVGLKVREGSRIAHGDKKLLGGKVLLDGGVRLSKGQRAVVVKDFAVDLRTHVVTATVGTAGPGARLGVLNDPKARLLPHTAPGDANLAIGGRLVPDAGVGAEAFAGAGATFEVNADLDIDLAYAMGLNAELGLGPSPFPSPDSGR